MHYEDTPISIVELKKFLKEYEAEIICVGCGKPLNSARWRLDYYPHSGGVKVKEFNNKRYWVYIEHEGYCHYQMALWKMEHRLLNTNPELYKEYLQRVYIKPKEGEFNE